MSTFKAVLAELEKTKSMVTDEINMLTLNGKSCTIVPHPEDSKHINYWVNPNTGSKSFYLTFDNIKDIAEYYEFIKDKV